MSCSKEHRGTELLSGRELAGLNNVIRIRNNGGKVRSGAIFETFLCD